MRTSAGGRSRYHLPAPAAVPLGPRVRPWQFLMREYSCSVLQSIPILCFARGHGSFIFPMLCVSVDTLSVPCTFA
jgi:hypothetical protein